MVDIAAALARLLQGDTPLLLRPDRAPAAPQAYERNERHERSERPTRDERPQRSEYSARGERPAREEHATPRRKEAPTAFERPAAPRSFDKPAHETSRIERPGFDKPAAERPRIDKGAPREKPDVGMESFRIEVGHAHGVKPANIVGAIANEAGLDSKYIGRIDIQDDYTVLDLPEGMPKELLMHLKKVWVSGQQLRIHKVGEGDDGGDAPRKFKPAAARSGKPSGFKPGPPGKLHRKGPPKPRE
jgi:ATP-dependent RNA helicase DeaD